MYLQENLRKLIEEKLKALNKLRPLSPLLLGRLRERFEVEMTYNSNAIEGNTLTLKETFMVIQQGLTVKGKPLKDHLEAKNHKDALDFLYDLIEHESNITISEQLVKNLHSLVIQDINRSIAGQYRKVDVFITGTDHTPPSTFEVPQKMKELTEWMKSNQRKLNIVEFSALLHHKFVHIHPFADGNGRTGRLLMNVFLMNYGLPMTIILKNDRGKYYRALALADAGKPKTLVNFVGQAVLRSLNIYLDSLTESDKKEKFITLHEASKHFPYSGAYLGKLAKEGKIDAHKEKRNWLTTLEAIERYMKNSKKRKK